MLSELPGFSVDAKAPEPRGRREGYFVNADLETRAARLRCREAIEKGKAQIASARAELFQMELRELYAEDKVLREGGSVSGGAGRSAGAVAGPSGAGSSGAGPSGSTAGRAVARGGARGRSGTVEADLGYSDDELAG